MSRHSTRFAAALGPSGAEALRTAARHLEHSPPEDWVRWYCTDMAGVAPAALLGVMSPERARVMETTLEACSMEARGAASRLHWNTAHLSPTERSGMLQHALEQCHVRGLVHGWRNEAFAFWHHECFVPPDDGHPPLLAVERAGFRFLGMRSHAVHINGFTPDGRLWCGRRSLTKATDPDMLDNVTAGGLPAGESPLACALRELQEEAGAVLEHTRSLHDAGLVRTARLDTGGWHDETLLVYNWDCPNGWEPANRDGEVSGFLCLSASEALERVQAVAFTRDAVASLTQGLKLL